MGAGTIGSVSTTADASRLIRPSGQNRRIAVIQSDFVFSFETITPGLGSKFAELVSQLRQLGRQTTSQQCYHAQALAMLASPA